MPDERWTIPVACIKPWPFNPKTPIAGAYKAGLSANIDHFAPKDLKPGENPLRDDLKCWPDPEEPGTYFVIDGNQRLGLLVEKNVEQVECRVLADLDLEDAKLFAASFDRNVAKYDESKLATLAAELQAKGAALVAKLLRPDTALVTPPEREEPAALTQAKAELAGAVPIMFQLSATGFRLAKEAILKSKNRLIREKRLIAALQAFAEALEVEGPPPLALAATVRIMAGIEKLTERQTDDLIAELAIWQAAVAL